MKGYLFCAKAKFLDYRTERFIEYEDPGFIGREVRTIEAFWKFDTESMDSMIDLFSRLRLCKVDNREVNAFCNAIGFDFEKFKTEVQELRKKKLDEINPG